YGGPRPRAPTGHAAWCRRCGGTGGATMTAARWWNEFVADTADVVGVPLQIAMSVLVAILIALLWYTYPAWLRILRPSRSARRSKRPAREGRRRWRWSRRLRWRLRWRRRRRDRKRHDSSDSADLASDLIPDVPAATLVMTADELAAAG